MITDAFATAFAIHTLTPSRNPVAIPTGVIYSDVCLPKGLQVIARHRVCTVGREAHTSHARLPLPRLGRRPRCRSTHDAAQQS